MSKLARRGDLSRYREIAAVLARHGFGWLVAELQLPRTLPLRLKPSGRGRSETSDQAIHLRLAFEELGTTFVKVGQFLSTRPDLLPPEYVAELSKLQEAVPPITYAEVAAVVAAELGAPPEEVFAAFDREPLAAASIGQVHAATLRGGEEVIVKVQRPGVAAAVERDLAVLGDLAGLLAKHTSFGRDYDTAGLADEFAFGLRCELRYVREGQTADRFRLAFAKDPDLHVPLVYWQHTTERVLVQERLHGIKVNDLAGLAEAGIDPKQVAATTVRLMLEQIFAHGIFHADPHPGNVLVEAGGRIGLMDFGMIGRLDDQLQDGLTRLFVSLSRGDAERILDELRETGVVQGQIDRPALKRDLDHMLACYINRSAKEMSISGVFAEITGMARRHRLRLPSDLLLMARVMGISEGVGLQLDPDFQFVAFARPYVERFWLEKRSPARVGKRVAEGLAEVGELGLVLPRHLRRLLVQLERGELGSRVQLLGTEPALAQLQRMVNRIAVSILVGALVIGLSQFIHMAAPVGLEELAARFFGLSFVGATVLGFWLLVSLLRSGGR